MSDDEPFEKKAGQKLDTLTDDGGLMAARLRGDVHAKGYWHRYVHVWVLDVDVGNVMMQQRAPAKKIFGGMWSCCTGHIEAAASSSGTAALCLQEELKLAAAETDLEFLFSCKESTSSGELILKQWIDVYALPLATPPLISSMAVDVEEATALKYVSLEELKSIYEQRLGDHVVPNNPEYFQRLFYKLNKLCRDYHLYLPKEDSDDERTHQSAAQLLDTLGEDGLVDDRPGARGEVHRNGVWHRAVHVWVLDTANHTVLVQQRSRKKQHFTGMWGCTTGHVDMGSPSHPAAVKAVQGDIGLTLQEEDLEFLFQVRAESDTGGGVVLNQIVDVFCVSMPCNSYLEAPAATSMTLARGEVDSVKYMLVSDLADVWRCGSPEYIIFGSEEYRERLFFLLERKCVRCQHESAGGTWPKWSLKANPALQA